MGVFVEPSDRAERAYARTERHAISVRAREGGPAPTWIEPLMAWVLDRVRAAERDEAPLASRLSNPPSPWVRLDA